MVCGFPAPLLTTKEGFDLYLCSSCRHIFVWPLPSPEDLVAAYSQPSDPRRAGPAGSVSHGYRFSPSHRLAIATIRGYASGGRILDVGCGEGQFSVLAARHGYEPVGVELNPRAAARARANGIDVRACTLEEAGFAADTFDVVHLGDVIEHVRDLESFMRAVRRITRTGGVLYVRTPNHEAFFPKSTLWLHKHLGIPWSHPTPPHHLHQFSPSSLRRLLEKHGFSWQQALYTKCSLAYEIGATRVGRRFKRGLRNRKAAEVAQATGAGVLVCASYLPLWLADRLVLGRPDFHLHVLAVKA